MCKIIKKLASIPSLIRRAYINFKIDGEYYDEYYAIYADYIYLRGGGAGTEYLVAASTGNLFLRTILFSNAISSLRVAMAQEDRDDMVELLTELERRLFDLSHSIANFDAINGDKKCL